MLELIRERVPNLAGASIVLCFPDATLVNALLNESAQVDEVYEPSLVVAHPMLFGISWSRLLLV